MGEKTTIEWSDATWTPIRARVKDDAADIARRHGYASLVQLAHNLAGRVGPHCEHASIECSYCYSETNNGRCLPFNGTGLPFDRRSRDLVDIFVDRNILSKPLTWKKPLKVFVCSQTDLFGEWVTDGMIDEVRATMGLADWHTYQILTKRAERMQQFWKYLPGVNVWLGVSVGNRAAKDRLEPLRDCNAPVRFVSFEPLLEDLGEIDFTGIDLAIIGGESGFGARPCHLEWIHSISDQAVDAGTRVFVKQLGSAPFFRIPLKLKDKKGGNPDEWPELLPRELPA